MSEPRPVHERCWCWQYGRCLTDCPTANLPRPVPLTDDNWRRAWQQVLDGTYTDPCDGAPDLLAALAESIERARRGRQHHPAACGHAVADRLDLHWSAELEDEVCPDCCEDCNP